MKSTLAAVVALVLAAPSLSFAVNCAQVNRYLQTGRSVEDVSTTMVVPEEEVRKCQEEAEKAEKKPEDAKE